MTPAERITDLARWWLKLYTEARNEANTRYYDLAIAQRTEQVLCPHPAIKHLYGEMYECKVCGGVSR